MQSINVDESTRNGCEKNWKIFFIFFTLGWRHQEKTSHRLHFYSVHVPIITELTLTAPSFLSSVGKMAQKLLFSPFFCTQHITKRELDGKKRGRKWAAQWTIIYNFFRLPFFSASMFQLFIGPEMKTDNFSFFGWKKKKCERGLLEMMLR